MHTITTIGLDIAKSVFQVHGIDAEDRVIIRQQLKRRYVLAFFAKLATALVASVADPKVFRSGRNFSAWIGLVPKQHSSGGKDRLGSISKQGGVLTIGTRSAQSIMASGQTGSTNRPDT